MLRKIFLKIIPMKCWGWKNTQRLMKLNYYMNKKYYDNLSKGIER